MVTGHIIYNTNGAGEGHAKDAVAQLPQVQLVPSQKKILYNKLRWRVEFQ